MGTYSPEPPRRTCTLHVPLDYAREGFTPDSSPQPNNAFIQGGDFVLGPVGQGVEFSELGEHVEVETAVRLHKANAFTVSVWARPTENRQGSDDTIFAKSGEFSIRNGTSSSGVEFVLEDTSGNTHEVSHSQHLTPGEYTHIVATYDGFDMRLYLDGEEVSSMQGGFDITSGSGTVFVGQDTALSSPKQFIGAVSDARTYRSVLSPEQINSLYRLGVDHWADDPLRDGWENDGIPIRGTNLQLAGALSEQDAYTRRQLDYVEQARYVEEASGSQLDRIGRVAGITRRENESDDVYRARIIGTVSAGRSRGTIEDLIDIASSIVGVSGDAIEVSTNYEANPATVEVFVPNTALQDTELDASDIASILEDAVLAGHEINALAQSVNPFTLRNDSQTNDASLGLTSDSTSDGGELVEDV